MKRPQQQASNMLRAQLSAAEQKREMIQTQVKKALEEMKGRNEFRDEISLLHSNFCACTAEITSQ